MKPIFLFLQDAFTTYMPRGDGFREVVNINFPTRDVDCVNKFV
jgi:hypothetical protein